MVSSLMRGSRKFCKRGSKFDDVFLFFVLVDDWIVIQISLHCINGPSSTHLSLAGRRWFNIECWLGSFVIFQGTGNSIAKKTYIFVIFQGGGGGGVRTTCPLSGSAHEPKDRLSMM